MYVRVLVKAGAKKESLTAESEDRLLVSVKEPAERNMANGRVRELVAAHFKVPLGKVRIVGGHQRPSKLISVALAGD
jgi:uncharacterized protein YggU (UPF0235/DUF167 family)